MTLSLAAIATQVGLPSPAAAEQHVLDMIAAGEIFATINQVAGSVEFHDDPQQVWPGLARRGSASRE